ncbi:hypothetical protein JCM11491_000190 [Sporobolomyces phaffii]
MSTDWAKLKAKRASRAGTSPAAAASVPPPSSSNANDATSSHRTEAQAATVASSTRLDYCHPDLPPSLAVHQIPLRGRGVVAQQSYSPGATLLSTVPLVSVLDNRNLSQRCSNCYRSSEDTLEQRILSQCSLCHIVQYCSAACQTRDWRLHKLECKALRNMAATAREKGKGKAKAAFVPDTPLRAIGRLLWLSELEGPALWEQIDSLESHREKLTLEEQERFFHLSIGVAGYVGQPTVLKWCKDSAALIDLLSRFTSNSFSLTSPTDLTNIGVSISPLTALFNHSCRPNAVVVFPVFPAVPSTLSPASNAGIGNMRVVAIRPIGKGEEVVTSYVDLALPGPMRRDELRERYKFECRCEACGDEDNGGGSVDPRKSFVCPRSGCDGLLNMIDGGGEATCSQCCEICQVPDVGGALEAAKNAHDEADKTQYSDPAAALINLSNSISSLGSFSPALSPASYPLFHASSMALTLQIHSRDFATAFRTALSAWHGATQLYSYGHPVRCILSSTIAQLAAIPPADPTPEADLEYWSNLKDRTAGLRMMVEALKECEIGFGTSKGGGGGGGQVGAKLRRLIRDQEEGIAMARKVARELQ